ncbi:hypothetical protein V2J09_021953 [Rumex salicifolius]
MEKSKTFPDYPASYVKARYVFEDQHQQPKSYSFNGPNSNGGDDFGMEGNPELKRKKRVASYNMYATEASSGSRVSLGTTILMLETVESAISRTYPLMKISEK